MSQVKLVGFHLQNIHPTNHQLPYLSPSYLLCISSLQTEQRRTKQAAAILVSVCHVPCAYLIPSSFIHSLTFLSAHGFVCFDTKALAGFLDYSLTLCPVGFHLRAYLPATRSSMASEKQYGTTPPISVTLPTEGEKQSTESLFRELKAQGTFEHATETQKRYAQPLLTRYSTHTNSEPDKERRC